MPIPDEGVEIIERYLLQFGIRGRAATESDVRSDEYDLVIPTGARCIAAPLMALSVGRKAQARRWAGLYALLDALGVDERCEDRDAAREPGGVGRADAQVWNAMMDMLDQAEGCWAI